MLEEGSPDFEERYRKIEKIGEGEGQANFLRDVWNSL